MRLPALRVRPPALRAHPPALRVGAWIGAAVRATRALASRDRAPHSAVVAKRSIQGARARGTDAHLVRFAALCTRARKHGLRSLSADDAAALPRLYRYAATQLAHVETSGRDPAAARALRAQLAQGHGLLFHGLERDPRGFFTRTADFLLREVPSTIRSEWRPIAVAFAILYGLGLAAYFAVRSDMDVAWSLLDPKMVAQEIQQLQATAAGEPFRGNFTFGLGESPTTSALIMTNNIRVGVLFFASGLVPPLFAYILALNGLMVGTYTAVAAHWGQGLEISSILWCHGVLEIQAFVLAGASGLVLVRGLVMPGAWSRSHALRLGARRAWRLLAPVFPMLLVAGFVEGFVTPHAPVSVRLAVAVTSGVLLLAWALIGGRGATDVAAPTVA